jgi:hypothetical protein
VFNKIVKIENKIKEVKLRENLLLKKEEGHYKCIIFILIFQAIKSHNQYIVTFSLVESGTMIIIFIIQTFYIKNLLNRI